MKDTHKDNSSYGTSSGMPLSRRLTLAGILVTVGIVFGDIGTSPLYVMKAIIGVNPDYEPDYVLGAISCVIWTLTMQTTVKYVVIALRADNKGRVVFWHCLRCCGVCRDGGFLWYPQ